MNFEPLSIEYRVDIPKEKFIEKLLNDDSLEDDSLFSVLMNIPNVNDVEYNGHFGSYVFFKLELNEYEDENRVEKIAEKLEEIKETIENFLND